MISFSRYVCAVLYVVNGSFSSCICIISPNFFFNNLLIMVNQWPSHHRTTKYCILHRTQIHSLRNKFLHSGSTHGLCITISGILNTRAASVPLSINFSYYVYGSSGCSFFYYLPLLLSLRLELHLTLIRTKHICWRA